MLRLLPSSSKAARVLSRKHTNLVRLYMPSLLVTCACNELLLVCKKLPVVVIDGSGKAADLLAYAYYYTHSPLYATVLGIS